MRTRAAALAGRLARHHADAVLGHARPAASAAGGWVGLLSSRLASSAAGTWLIGRMGRWRTRLCGRPRGATRDKGNTTTPPLPSSFSTSPTTSPLTTAGPLTPPPPPPAWRARASWALARPYASSSSSAPEPSAASPAAQPVLTLTPAAADRIRDLLARPAAVAAGHTALRLTVEAGGCSGFSYVFALDAGPQKGDTAVTAAGDDPTTAAPLLIIDPVSLGLVRGGTIDFLSELIKAGFEVTVNPNADAGCGCGASFTPKF